MAGRKVSVSLLLGLAPLVIYSVFAPLSVSLALWLAFATAFTFAVRTFVESGTLRLLDGTGMVLFGSLALFDGFVAPGLALATLNLIAEAGLLLMSLWSLATRRPFAAQYVVVHGASGPAAARMNLVLTVTWAAAFAVMAGADAATSFVHRIPPGSFTVAALAALAGALTFSWQYGVYIGRRLGKVPFSGKR
jgi:hypothetical protein